MVNAGETAFTNTAAKPSVDFDKAVTQAIVSELINAIYVHEGGDVDIEFAFADQHRRMVEFIENNRRPDLSVVEMAG